MREGGASGSSVEVLGTTEEHVTWWGKLSGSVRRGGGGGREE